MSPADFSALDMAGVREIVDVLDDVRYLFCSALPSYRS